MMQHLRALRALFLAACIAAAFGLRAEEAQNTPAKDKKAKPAPAEMFAKLDADGNGSLSSEEFISLELAAFTAKQGNAEGAAEKVAAKKEMTLKKFAAKDKDGDGSLSLEEFSVKEPRLKKNIKEAAPEAPEEQM